MVMPETVSGIPERNAIWRAMLYPVVPWVRALPMITSSTSPGSIEARSKAASTA